MRCTAAPIDSVLRAREGGFSIQHSTALQLKEEGNDLVNKVSTTAITNSTGWALGLGGYLMCRM